MYFFLSSTQASEAARAWAEKRREAIARAKLHRARRDDDDAARASARARRAEDERLRRNVERAARETHERRAKREAEALAAKIRKDVELELQRERESARREQERACAEEGAKAARGTYVKVVPDGTRIVLSEEVELAPEPERRKVPAPSPRQSPKKPTSSERAGRAKTSSPSNDANAVTPEPEKKRAPKPTARGVKEWTPPNSKSKRPEVKSRAPLVANRPSAASKPRTVSPPDAARAPSSTATKSARTTLGGSKPAADRPATSKPGSVGRVSKPSGARPGPTTASRKRPIGGDNAGDKMHRQMFDKRESRRMNRRPFAASVKRWRDENLTASADEANAHETPARGSISVFARKRPLFDPERQRGEYDVVTVKGASTAVVHNCQMHADLKRMFVKHCAYTLSGGVFDDAVQEHEVYAKSAAPLVAQTLKGSVGALFMYGQTGSGKTHTMENIEKHAVDALFFGDSGLPGAKTIKVSYFEIAGKTCVDLLQPGRVEIRLKELFEEQGEELTGQMEVELVGAKEPEVTNAAELKKVIDEGKARRQTSSTQCNASSSRSHAVMRLTVTLANGSTGRLTLVDCAGSERKEDNTHHDEKQRKETAEINASLYALKECVRFRRLKFSGSGSSSVHVPYRNSPLTRVLAECFVRDDAGLAVIGTMSPASIDTEHSLATLKTINAIGGNDDNEGYEEKREDVAATLRIDAKTGKVTEEAAERRIAPVKWSHEDVVDWISTAAKGAFNTKVNVPSTLTGSQFVRMSALVLKGMCGGDEALATRLHKCLRAEVTRCSVTQRS